MEPKTERFVFENRPLGDWLLQLRDEDGAKRKTAAKVITKRFYMPTELSSPGRQIFLAGLSLASDYVDGPSPYDR
jgi:hypothetical protein